MISGIKLIFLARTNSDFRCFVGGFILIYIPTMCAWVSYSYNYATATKDTELIVNSVILMFVQDIDEWVLGILEAAHPSWLNKKMQNLIQINEPKLESSLALLDSSGGGCADVPAYGAFFENDQNNDSVEKELKTTKTEDFVTDPGSKVS